MDNEQIRRDYEKLSGHPYQRPAHVEAAEELPRLAKVAFFMGGMLIAAMMLFIR